MSHHRRGLLKSVSTSGSRRGKKDGDVGSNATSSHLAEMNFALTFQLPNDRCASGELEERACGP